MPIRSMLLEDKVIVVTGAAGRLGRRIVQRFAGEGAAIAAIVRNEDEARSLPFPEDGEGWAYPVDLANEELVRTCFDQIRNQFGRVEALVHTVGMWDDRPFSETSLADWHRVMQTNLTTTFLCFREAARVIDGPGQLIAFASVQGADRGAARQSAYSASKAGVIRLVEAVDAEFGHVTAHAIAPSTILYDDGGGAGVDVEHLVDIAGAIIGGRGEAVAGTTIRAYGPRATS